jgi:ABC-type transporter Mla MlaB component
VIPAEPAPYLRVTVTVAAHRLRLTLAGPLDAANAHLLADAARDAMRRHSAAACDVQAHAVTGIDEVGAAAVLACRAEAERRGLAFSLSGGPDWLRAALGQRAEPH